MTTNRAVLLGAVLGAVALIVVVALIWAARDNTLQPRRVVAEYHAAVQPEHRLIEAVLRKGQVLERMAEILGPLKLPRTLKLRLMPCDGDANAYFEEEGIRVCYEYIEAVLQQVAERDVSQHTTRRNLLMGAMADVFFHEFGHAAFYLLEIPVFGREEDAADQFSAYVMLNFAKNDARQLIMGAAFYFIPDFKDIVLQRPKPRDLAGQHGLPAQRFFNYICLAYGSDPKRFAAALAVLPKERAENCEWEYAQLDRAFRKLVAPYVDRAELARVSAKTWFELDPVK